MKGSKILLVLAFLLAFTPSSTSAALVHVYQVGTSSPATRTHEAPLWHSIVAFIMRL